MIVHKASGIPFSPCGVLCSDTAGIEPNIVSSFHRKAVVMVWILLRLLQVVWNGCQLMSNTKLRSKTV